MAACITRILHLEGFSPKLQTRDIKNALAGFENQYRIKWIDDTSLYLVFHEATHAKAFFLSMMGTFPTHLLNPENPASVVLSPYNGPDAASIIARTEARSPNPNNRSRSSSVNTNPMPNTRYTTPIIPNVGPVSPTVSMILLAAANGVGGSHVGYNYVTGIPNSNWNGSHLGYASPVQHQQLPRKLSHTSLRSRGSQSSLHDTFAYGSGSNYSLGPGGEEGMSAASSWATSPQSNTAIPGDIVYQTNGLTQTGIGNNIALPPKLPGSRSMLEDIAEASSREELSFSKSSAGTPVKNQATTIIVTDPTPESLQKRPKPLESGGGFVPVELPAGPQLEVSSSNESSRTDGGASTTSSNSVKTASSDSAEDPLKTFIDAFGQMGFTAIPPKPEVNNPTVEKTIPASEPAGRKNISPPRIGLPGKRMLGAALGIRHPALGPRVLGNATSSNSSPSGAVTVGNA